MKTFAQFIKETYHMQEKLDATVYGQVRYGAPPSKPKSDKQISNMVSKGIDDYKSGKPVQPPGKSTAKKRKFSFSGYANLSYEKKSGCGTKRPRSGQYKRQKRPYRGKEIGRADLTASTPPLP